MRYTSVEEGNGQQLIWGMYLLKGGKNALSPSISKAHPANLVLFSTVMNFNLRSIFVSSIAAIAIVALPFTVRAETMSSELSDRSGSDSAQTVLVELQRQPLFADIELTQQQQAQLTPIVDNTRRQIEALLTAEEKQQISAALANGDSFQTALSAIELPPDRQAKLRSIVQMAGLQAASILTPQQREQLRQNLQELRSQ